MTDPLATAVHRLTRVTLLAAVDELTKPQQVSTPIKDDDGKWVDAHTVTMPPLLTQLKEAVKPSSNTASGSSSLKSMRNLIDGDALFEYSKITAAIGDWCNIIQSERTRDPIADLRHWYEVFAPTTNDASFYVNQINKWVAKIRRLLNPPHTITIAAACPVCGKSEWGDLNSGGGPNPIQVEFYFDEDTGKASGHAATCRACRVVWEGLDAVGELSSEVYEKDPKVVANG